MGIESPGGVISGLDDNWPAGGESKTEGDNHIRLIKNVLKSQFPGVGGNGFATAIVATEAEINYLDGVSGPIQAQIGNLEANLHAPINTVMLFLQAAAPSGWVLVTSYADRVLRVHTSFSGTGGSWTISGHTLGTTTLSASQSGNRLHNHGVGRFDYVGTGGNYQVTAAGNGNFLQNASGVTSEDEQAASQPHGHTLSFNGAWRPAYVDAIPCKKL